MVLDRFDNSWKYIWEKRRDAPKEERWKWDYATWEPILNRIWDGDINNLLCPVCGQESVYFKYLVVGMTVENDVKVIRAERWVGCSNCGVQYHDRARLPDWIKNPEWEPAVEEWLKKTGQWPEW